MNTKQRDALLDNVVWSALSGPQARLSEGSAAAKRFLPGIAPFGSAPDFGAASLAAIAGLVRSDGPIALVSVDEIGPIDGLELLLRGRLDQMVLVDAAAIRADDGVAIERLGEADVPAMLALTEATRPGPFGPRTIELGAYYGIREQGRLVAMAGERLRIPGCTEVSAICVAPEQRGRGHAAALAKRVAAEILARGETPFLHVFEGNLWAIALYRKLGFEARRRMHLVNFMRNKT